MKRRVHRQAQTAKGFSLPMFTWSYTKLSRAEKTCVSTDLSSLHTSSLICAVIVKEASSPSALSGVPMVHGMMRYMPNRSCKRVMLDSKLFYKEIWSASKSQRNSQGYYHGHVRSSITITLHELLNSLLETREWT